MSQHKQASGGNMNSKPDRVLSVREFTELAGISVDTLRRLIKAGKGPAVVRLSERRCGIRESAGEAWLKARTTEPREMAA
jgi:predicted DNA-binding transcriptional regulator AlpA